MSDSRSANFGGGRGRTGAIGALPYILSFDLLAPRDHQSDRIAGDRLKLLKYSAPLLAAAHIVCGLGLFQAVVRDGGRSFSAFLMPLVTVLLLDLAFMFIVWRRSPFSRRPYLVIRATAGYVLLSGIFWTALTAPVAAEPMLVGGWLVRAAMVAGFAAGIVAFLATPALLALNIAIAVVATWLSGASHESLTLVGATVFCLFLYSLFSAREQMLTAEKRYATEWQSEKAQRFLAEFEQGGRGWFWETGADGGLSYISEQLAAEFRTNAIDLMDHPFTELFAVLDDDGGDGPKRTLGFYLSARFPFSDVTVGAAGREDLAWSLSGSPVFDEFGQFLGFRGIGTDLSEQKAAAAELRRLARYDTLTGLPNRTMMRTALEQALMGGGHRATGCALFLVDLDRFKAVNDSRGHAVGDALLRQVAQRLTAVLSGEGQVGRLGDDEFEVLLCNLDDEQRLGQLAERLIQQVSMPYMIDGAKIEIGASIGIAVARQGQTDAEQLVRDAAFALDAAKGAGRGTHRFFMPAMRNEARERQLLEQDLKEALNRGELHLLYQPLINSISEDLVGFEALARWDHPVRGSIPPDYFIPLAEECGLIGPIGEWVLRTACETASHWPNGIGVSVNLSPLQFATPSLPATVVSALAGSQLEAGRLELEITEGVFLDDSDATDEMFDRLKAIGVRLALDDFGTGYSSLGYLRKAPFDKIKIDQSFVRGAAHKDSRNGAIISAIVSLAESLGMDTTAEGVESYDELTLVRELGCSQVQGYIFGKPMRAEDALQFAESTGSGTAPPERYRPTRHTLIRTALLSWNDRSFQTRVRNISGGGAMLECERGLAPGARVELEMAGYGVVAGEVRWSENNRIGVRFDEEFDLQRLSAAARRKASVTKMRPRLVPKPDDGEDERRASAGGD